MNPRKAHTFNGFQVRFNYQQLSPLAIFIQIISYRYMFKKLLKNQEYSELVEQNWSKWSTTIFHMALKTARH